MKKISITLDRGTIGSIAESFTQQGSQLFQNLDQFGSIGSILAHTTGTMRITLAASLDIPGGGAMPPPRAIAPLLPLVAVVSGSM